MYVPDLYTGLAMNVPLLSLQISKHKGLGCYILFLSSNVVNDIKWLYGVVNDTT